MPFDGITSAYLSAELNENLAGGRVRKIYQPESDEIRLTVNRGRQNATLLISANPNNARLHLTDTSKENPAVPLTFCMSLRKHITGSEILSIEQLSSDRVILISLRAKNEFGEPCTKQLICEMTGRNSNVILTQINSTPEGEERIILDALKKIGSGKSRYRQILPGRPYLAPPEEDRLSLFDVSAADLTALLETGFGNGEAFLTGRFLGLSPAGAREIFYRAGLDGAADVQDLSNDEQARLAAAFVSFVSPAQAPEPSVYLNAGQPLDFYPLALTHLCAEDIKPYPSMSATLEAFYALRDKRMHFKTHSANLKRQLEQLRKKDAKKLQNLDKDYKNALKNEKNKRYGDLITANIWQLEKGMTEAQLTDYSDPELPLVTVPLKINESPSQNAQRFYKKYNKNKRAQEYLAEQITKTQDELYYIESLLTALSNSEELTELREIQYEFSHSGLTGERAHRSGGRKRPEPSKPLHFISSEGFDIYVGKNNYQNDTISTRLGTDEDCWLHVKDAPGSHVLIVANNRFITEQTVLEGGMLAAYYSKYRQSENVPVDYMEFKYVKKPKNAKPGFVIFTEHNTMYVTPDPAQIKALKRADAN